MSHYWKDGRWHEAKGFMDVIDALYPLDPEVEVSNLRRGLRSDRRGLLKMQGKLSGAYCRVGGSDVAVWGPQLPRGGLWVWDALLKEERLIDPGALANRKRFGPAVTGPRQILSMPTSLLLRDDHPAYGLEGFPLEARKSREGALSFGEFSVNLTPKKESNYHYGLNYLEKSLALLTVYMPLAPNSLQRVAFTVYKNRDTVFV